MKITGSHFKALFEEICALCSCCLHLLPGLWSSGGLAGHQVSSAPLRLWQGGKEPAFVLGPCNEGSAKLIAKWEGPSVPACLAAGQGASSAEPVFL